MPKYLDEQGLTEVFRVIKDNYANVTFALETGLGEGSTQQRGYIDSEGVTIPGATASGDLSVALGKGTTAEGENQVVLGSFNNNNPDNAFEIGKGTVDSRENAFAVSKNGDTTVNGNTTINGNISTNGNETINGKLIVTGVEEEGVIKGAEITGDVTATGDLTHEGDISLTGNLEINGDLNFIGLSKNITGVKEITADTANITNANIQTANIDTETVTDLSITGSATIDSQGQTINSITRKDYVDEQITIRQAIVKANQATLTEPDLVYFMQTLEEGMYRIKTDLWGHEFLFVSDMYLPVDPEAEVPVLQLTKEYSRYTANGTSYRYDFELLDWVLSAGGGAGGGGEVTTIQLTPVPLNFPLNFAHALGTDLSVTVNFTHSELQFATLKILRGTAEVETRGVNLGENVIDLTPHIRAGSNSITLRVTDGERSRSISYNITGVAIILTSTFNDAVAYGSTVNIPFRVEAEAQRKLYFTIDDVAEEIVLTQTNNIKGLTGLTHGVHIVEMQGAAIIGDTEILSSKIRFSIMVSTLSEPALISSRFNLLESTKGSVVAVDYIVYNPIQEFNDVTLKIDGDIVGQLTVGRQREIWTVRNLEEGVRTLRIESANTFKEFTITITPLDISFTNVEDSFLKLYLTATTKSNSDVNKELWENSYGLDIDGILTGFNYSSNGWVDGVLVLNGNAKALIPYKPFETPVSNLGRTIEIEFETTTGLEDEFISCWHGNRGFKILKDRAMLKSNDTQSEVFFKENEKIKLSFVINPVDNTTLIYINGVMTGLDRMNSLTSFQQSTAQNIIINEKAVDGKVYNIRVYDRALSHQEVLQNYLFDIVDLNEKINNYVFSDVFNQSGTPDIEKVKERMPVMVIRTYETDANGNNMPLTADFRPYVSVTYEDNLDPSKNFELANVRLRTQGTSSLEYPVKNYRLYSGDLDTNPVTFNNEMHPAIRINLKADYMESSMSTDPAIARLFNQVHTKPIPPKAIDGVSRTTIWTEGAIALFSDDGNILRFEGVFNNNGDKGDNKQWGFYPELNDTFPNARRFEVLFNAANHAVAFTKSDTLTENEFLLQVAEGFESRWPIDEDDVADLVAAEDYVGLRENYGPLVEFIEFIDSAELVTDPITNKKSFATNQDLINFKAIFEQRAEKEYFIKFLLTIFIFGMIDNFGKDLLLNTWGNEGGEYSKWYLSLYDLDSGVGIDNQGFMTDSEGNLLFDYNIEMEDEGVFAQASSKLWDAVIAAYPEDIKTTYAELRSNIYTFANIWKYLYTEQIATISKGMYNANAIRKYIETPGSDQYLWMLNGDRIDQMSRWIINRLAFLDSKYDYNTDASLIKGRLAVEDIDGINFQVKSSIHQWVTGQLGNTTAGYMKTRTLLGETATLNHTYASGTKLPFVEFKIFSGQYITELVNFKDLPIRTLQLGDGTQLNKVDLSKVAPSSELQSISFGANSELVEVNLQNNSGLGGLLDLSEAIKLKKLDLRGTNITSVILPEGGILEELYLPNTITSLQITDQAYLTDDFFEIQGTPEFDSLRIENSPGIDSIDLIQYLAPTGAVRITNIQLVTNKTSFLDDLVDMLEGRQGIDSFGNIEPKPVLTGAITIYTGSDFDKNYYQSKLPNIIFNHITLPEGLTYAPSGNNLVISGYSGAAHTINIPESVPFGIDGVDYVLGAAVDIRPVIGIVGTNIIKSSILNIFIPSTVTTISSTTISSGFEGRVMTNLSSKPIGWNITYENILFDEQPFFEEDYFFIRVYDDNTKIELLPILRDNEELVVIPRTFNDLTITEIPMNVLRGSIHSIYIPNTILTINQNLSVVNFVLTEHLESSGIVSGPNVFYEIEDSVETYTVTYFRNNNITEIFTRTWYAFLGIRNILGSPDYLIDSEPIEIPFQGNGDTSIEVFEPVDYRTIVWTGSAYELTQVIVDIEEADGSYVLTIPDEHNDGINGLKACNPSNELFTEINFPAYSRNKIKEIYYYSNMTSSGAIPGFSNSTSYSRVTLGFLGNDNFPYREKLALYTKKTTLNGMRDGDMTEVHFVNGFSTSPWENFGLSENKFKNVDSFLASILAQSGNSRLGGTGTFIYNEIETLEIPYGYTNIGEYMFYSNQLTSITIPNSVTIIDSYAFANNQLTSVTIPNSVTSLSGFSNNQLTSITIPNSVTIIDSYAFEYNQLTSVTIPNSVTRIDARAFANNQLTSVTIPNSVTSLRFNAFSNNKLTSVVISNSVTSIESGVFNSNQLTSITIPNSVTSIKYDAFRKNPLTSVTIHAATPPTIDTGTLSTFDNASSITCYVPAGSGAAYQSAEGWSDMTIVEMD